MMAQRSAPIVSLQDYRAERARHPYCPSNGTEGEAFYSRWCAHCVRDRRGREEEADGCDILNRTLLLRPNDPDYPKEWRDDGPSGPRCTAFLSPEEDPWEPLDPAAVIRPLL